MRSEQRYNKLSLKVALIRECSLSWYEMKDVLITQYLQENIVHRVTRGTLEIMVFLRPTRGDGGSYGVMYDTHHTSIAPSGYLIIVQP